MNQVATPVDTLRPQKEMVEVNGVEVAFPGAGTGARYVWDLCLHAIETGESSTFVVETAATNSKMSKPSINSQITYFRKATGLELSRRVNTAKAEERAAKAAEREAAKVKRIAEGAEKRVTRIEALKKRIVADTEKLAELEAEEDAFQATGVDTDQNDQHEQDSAE